jgi:hypothetical protein
MAPMRCGCAGSKSRIRRLPPASPLAVRSTLSRFGQFGSLPQSADGATDGIAVGPQWMTVDVRVRCAFRPNTRRTDAAAHRMPWTLT